MKFALSNLHPATGGGVHMEIIVSFIIAFMAGVISHLVCKWLDSKDKKDNK